MCSPRGSGIPRQEVCICAVKTSREEILDCSIGFFDKGF